MGLGVLAAGTFYAVEPEMASLPIRLIFLFLLLADAVCYFVAAWGVCRDIKWVYPLAVILLIINTLALIFDNIGVIDLSVAAFNILLLILLIINHKKSK
jgi:hypothetical protein